MDPVEQKPRQPQKSKAGISLRTRALAMLARREYSRLELERKLAQHTENPDLIPELLDDFERRGWLSEQRFVDQVTTTRRRRFGAQRIVHELREKGISEAAVAGVRQQLQESELEAARVVWMKKFGKVASNASERSRQVRFLQGRGFSLETAMRITKQGGNDD